MTTGHGVSHGYA